MSNLPSKPKGDALEKKRWFRVSDASPEYDQIRCGRCGAVNRINGNSKGIPICGRCREELLAEPRPPENADGGLKVRWVGAAIIGGLTLVIIAASLQAPGPSVAVPDRGGQERALACSNPQAIRTGIFKAYDPYLEAEHPAHLTIRTLSSQNYFIKLETTVGAIPVASYFITGGETLEADVPLGNFTLKYATGQTWCGEQDYFGADTSFFKAADTFEFDQQSTEHGYSIKTWTVELIPQRSGNLKTYPIRRGEF